MQNIHETKSDIQEVKKNNFNIKGMKDRYSSQDIFLFNNAPSHCKNFFEVYRLSILSFAYTIPLFRDITSQILS